jgi:hypothetical protein
MITCVCGQKIYNIKQIKNVKNIGLAIYGECPKCGYKMPCSTLWRHSRTVTCDGRHTLSLKPT